MYFTHCGPRQTLCLRLGSPEANLKTDLCKSDLLGSIPKNLQEVREKEPSKEACSVMKVCR